MPEYVSSIIHSSIFALWARRLSARRLSAGYVARWSRRQRAPRYFALAARRRRPIGVDQCVRHLARHRGGDVVPVGGRGPVHRVHEVAGHTTNHRNRPGRRHPAQDRVSDVRPSVNAGRDRVRIGGDEREISPDSGGRSGRPVNFTIWAGTTKPIIYAPCD